MDNSLKDAENIIEVYVQHNRENLVKLARTWEPGMLIANNEKYKSLAKKTQ